MVQENEYGYGDLGTAFSMIFAAVTKVVQTNCCKANPFVHRFGSEKSLKSIHVI